MKPKLQRGTLDGLWSDPAHWRSGVIYCCKADPRIVVPKRVRWQGWTFNFAHHRAWLALVAMIAVVAFPVSLLAASLEISRWGWLGLIAGIITLVSLGCWFLASPRRFEE